MGEILDRMAQVFSFADRGSNEQRVEMVIVVDDLPHVDDVKCESRKQFKPNYFLLLVY